MASGIILGHAEPLEPSFGPQAWAFQIVYDFAAIDSVNEREGGVVNIEGIYFNERSEVSL
jgi:hypothetical protein